MKKKRFLGAKYKVKQDKAKKLYPDRMQFFGSIKLDFDPVAYQRQCRDEWERDIHIPGLQNNENSAQP